MVRDLPTFLEDLVCLLLGYAFNLLQVPPRRVSHGLDGVVSPIYDELDITLGETGQTLHDRYISAKDPWECALAVETHLESCQRRGRTRASHALIACLRLVVLFLCLGHFCYGSGGRCLKTSDRKSLVNSRIHSRNFEVVRNVFSRARIMLVANLSGLRVLTRLGERDAAARPGKRVRKKQARRQVTCASAGNSRNACAPCRSVYSVLDPCTWSMYIWRL